jgi:hypothetical protein
VEKSEDADARKPAVDISVSGDDRGVVTMVGSTGAEDCPATVWGVNR